MSSHQELMKHVVERIIQPMNANQTGEALHGANELVVWLGMLSAGVEGEKRGMSPELKDVLSQAYGTDVKQDPSLWSHLGQAKKKLLAKERTAAAPTAKRRQDSCDPNFFPPNDNAGRAHRALIKAICRIIRVGKSKPEHMVRFVRALGASTMAHPGLAEETATIAVMAMESHLRDRDVQRAGLETLREVSSASGMVLGANIGTKRLTRPKVEHICETIDKVLSLHAAEDGDLVEQSFKIFGRLRTIQDVMTAATQIWVAQMRSSADKPRADPLGVGLDEVTLLNVCSLEASWSQPL